MAEIELKATNLHWLEGCDPYEDCCVHGGVYLKLQDHVVSDGANHDWAISTSAFLMLKSVLNDFNTNEFRHLIPHCGHTMFRDGDRPDGLFLEGCNTGIAWVIRHSGHETIHDLGKESVPVPRESWAKAVCDFSDEVHQFMMTAWPKKLDDQFDREGFELFMRLWDRYRSEANLLHRRFPR